jgi:hypothetical protein
MQRFIITIILAFTLLSVVIAQDSAQEQSKPTSRSEQNKIYWGGQLGLSFGSLFRLKIVPMVGYKITPKFHTGGTFGYSYIKDRRYASTTVISHNFGGSVFSRYLVVRGLYAHVEFAYWSYNYQTANFDGERSWVPFLFVGGGYIQPVSPSTVLYVEILWDVLRDENSPFNSSDPFVSMGVGIGF